MNDVTNQQAPVLGTPAPKTIDDHRHAVNRLVEQLLLSEGGSKRQKAIHADLERANKAKDEFEFGVSPSAHSIQAKIQQVNAAAKLTARFVVDAQKLNPSKVQELFEVNLNAEYIRKHGGKAIKLKRTGKYYYLYVTFEHGYPPDFDCVAATSFTTDDFARLSQAEKPVHKTATGDDGTTPSYIGKESMKGGKGTALQLDRDMLLAMESCIWACASLFKPGFLTRHTINNKAQCGGGGGVPVQCDQTVARGGQRNFSSSGVPPAMAQTTVEDNGIDHADAAGAPTDATDAKRVAQEAAAADVERVAKERKAVEACRAKTAAAAANAEHVLAEEHAKQKAAKANHGVAVAGELVDAVANTHLDGVNALAAEQAINNDLDDLADDDAVAALTDTGVAATADAERVAEDRKAADAKTVAVSANVEGEKPKRRQKSRRSQQTVRIQRKADQTKWHDLETETPGPEARRDMLDELERRLDVFEKTMLDRFDEAQAKSDEAQAKSDAAAIEAAADAKSLLRQFETLSASLSSARADDKEARDHANALFKEALVSLVSKMP